MGLSRNQIDQWPVSESGLAGRVVHCLQAAGVTTIGLLRARTAAEQRQIRRFGRAAARNVQWFCDWAERLESGKHLPIDLRMWLGEFLAPTELFTVEQRYGLTDPLFRPQSKRRTLREIAEAGGGHSREQVRQVLRRAGRILSTRLARAGACPVLDACRGQIDASGEVVTSAELAGWRGATWLAGYQPWGALLLLSETTQEITRHHDYFSTLPTTRLEQIEQRLFQAVEQTGEPVTVEKVAGNVTPRLASVILDRHPLVDATLDGRFFLFPDGARVLLNGLTGEGAELAARYNALMAPHSRREASELHR